MRPALAIATTTLTASALLSGATAHASTDSGTCPQGGNVCPPDYTCAVMGGYPGACTNNGLTAEGYMDGCTTDMQGVKWWAVIGAVFVHGNARFIFHQPIFAGHLEAGDIQGPGKRFEWSNDRQESANRVTFSIIRDSHTKQTRIKRAWIRCTCPSHGECKRAPEGPTQPGKES